MAAIGVPAIVISGAHDRVDPPDVLRRTLLPRLPQATLHVLPGVGHLLPLEAPREVAALVGGFARSVG
jgi:pimeloyl-ACP methyl ester carboxylesterase